MIISLIVGLAVLGLLSGGKGTHTTNEDEKENKRLGCLPTLCLSLCALFVFEVIGAGGWILPIVVGILAIGGILAVIF